MSTFRECYARGDFGPLSKSRAFWVYLTQTAEAALPVRWRQRLWVMRYNRKNRLFQKRLNDPKWLPLQDRGDLI